MNSPVKNFVLILITSIGIPIVLGFHVMMGFLDEILTSVPFGGFFRNVFIVLGLGALFFAIVKLYQKEKNLLK